MNRYYVIILGIRNAETGDTINYQLKWHICAEKNKIDIEKFKNFKGVIQIAEEYDYLILDAYGISGDDYKKVGELDHQLELVDYSKNRKTGEYNRYYIRTGLAGDSFEEAEEVAEISLNDGGFKYDDSFDHILRDLSIDTIIEWVNSNQIKIV